MYYCYIIEEGHIVVISDLPDLPYRYLLTGQYLDILPLPPSYTIHLYVPRNQ